MIRPDISWRNPWAVSGPIHAARAPVIVSRITLTATAMGIAEKKSIHFLKLLKGARNANTPVRARRDVKDLIPEQASTTSREVLAR